MTEMIVTVADKSFRFQFETEEDAMNFIDTSEDVKGLTNVEQLS